MKDNNENKLMLDKQEMLYCFESICYMMNKIKKFLKLESNKTNPYIDRQIDIKQFSEKIEEFLKNNSDNVTIMYEGNNKTHDISSNYIHALKQSVNEYCRDLQIPQDNEIHCLFITLTSLYEILRKICNSSDEV